MTTLPLSQRIDAPAGSHIPHTPGVSWRAATEADIDGITEFMQLADRVDHPQYLTHRDDVAAEFHSSDVTPAADTLLGVTDDGEIVAWGVVSLGSGQDTLIRVFLIGAVHPRWRGRGIGRQVLAWQENRGLQLLATSDKTLPGWLIAFADDAAKASVALLTRAGFPLGRAFLELTRDLSDDIPEPEIPEGIEMARLDDSRGEALRLARNDAFRDHWGSQPADEELWSHVLGHSTHRPDLSFLALADDGEIAGFVVTSVNQDDWEGQGFSSAYIELVGVTRAWRGQRIAPALLGHALHALASEGLDRAVLHVDAESPTGALALYERVGFREATRNLNFAKVY